jgi:uncharacterized protein YjbI with pentapeptide repeats
MKAHKPQADFTIKPRVVSPVTGQVLPLDDMVRTLIQTNDHGVILIVGGPGSGKATALRYLQASEPAIDGFIWEQTFDRFQIQEQSCDRVIICATSIPKLIHHPVACLQLAPWTPDDLIEYLLALHPSQCASVMSRLNIQTHQANQFDLPNGPLLWSIVLDRMASDEAAVDIRAILQDEIRSRCDNDFSYETAMEFAKRNMTEAGENALQTLMIKSRAEPQLQHLLSQPYIKQMLSIEAVVHDLIHEQSDILSKTLSATMVQQIGLQLKDNSQVIEALTKIVNGPEYYFQAMAASILHAAGTGWTPNARKDNCFGIMQHLPRLKGGVFQRADWRGLDLAFIDLSRADLSTAILTNCTLDQADLSRAQLPNAVLANATLALAKLSGAQLHNADLSCVQADHIDFSNADLTHCDLTHAKLMLANFSNANLTGVNFRHAYLALADLTDATITDADFSHACLNSANLMGKNLTVARFPGASFAFANLIGCNLEQMELPGADFGDADLSEALLTGSHMPGANFEGADLSETGLADIQWEGANLCDVRFNDATFHMGSSRSGLIDNPLASEGSRTGYYTDEYDEQFYKSPEDIRKANLCEADLTGAHVFSTDFYLVDLRGARYSPVQERHFRRCRAILHDRP